MSAADEQRFEPAISGRLSWLFAPFERWIDPFENGPDGDVPNRLGAFIAYFLRQARWPFVAFLLLSGIVGLVETSLFWFVGLVVDALNQTTRATVWDDNLWLFAGMAVVLLVVRTGAWTLSTLINEQALPPFFQRVRWQNHRRVLRQSFRFFQDDFAGRIAQKVMQSGQSLGDFAINLINSIWFFVVFGVTSIGLFAALDWRLAVVLVVWFAIYLAIVFTVMPQVRERSKAMSNQRAVMSGRLVDSYTNVSTVKLFAAATNEDAFVRDAMETHVRRVGRFTRLLTVLRMSLTTLNGVMLVILGWLCVAFWQAGQLTTGEIATVLGLGLRLNNMSGWMMFQINGIFRDLGTIQDSIDTVAQPIDVQDVPRAGELSAVRGDVRFDQATFTYGRGEGGIRDLVLDVPAGQKVGVVGRSGAGKTTLVNLALRLYDLEGGRITIDGRDIRSVTQDSLRRQIGVVSQDTSLLHRSVAANIAYGRPAASRAQIEEAARQANAHDFIEGLQDVRGRRGYEAHVGERGVKLSGGQRQRIAIARVFLKDAPILMLDEATSALDSEVEAAIQENLLALMEGKTVVAVAHRLSTIAHLDRLVVMDDGRVVEDGTHDELIHAGDLYASLWARQSGGFLPVEDAA